MSIKLGAIYHQADQTIDRLRFPVVRVAHVVQYAHQTGGVFYNATLSDLDGTVIATWSYDEEGERVTRDRPMEPSVFTQLWRGIETLSVFRDAFTEQLDRAVDPSQHHIVTLISGRVGEVKREICLVPAASADAGLTIWLEMLGRPDQPPTDAEQASASRWMDEVVDEMVRQVVADVRWNDQRDDMGVEVFVMLLYGFALKAASHRMFASDDDVDAAIARGSDGARRRVARTTRWIAPCSAPGELRSAPPPRSL